MAIIQFIEESTAEDKTQQLAKILSTGDAAKENIAELTDDPATLADKLQSMIYGEDVPGEGGIGFVGGLKALRRIIKFTSSTINTATSTASGVQALANQEAIRDLVVQTGMVEMARLTKDLELESFDEAVELRTEISGLLQTEMGKTASDEVYKGLSGISGDMVRSITEKSANLKRLQSINVPSTSNSLVLAYELYGDAEREKEIVGRNKVDLPGFLSPAKKLRVLNG